MARLRKTFVVSVMMVTVLSMSMVVAPGVSAAEAQAGDLIKMEGLSSVYYLGADGKRYVFPNEKTYMSWYSDFSSVKTIPQSELESYPLGANVTVRPGTKLVKITTDPKVYAVESGGNLVHVPDEATAKALYGDNWAQRVIDVPDAFFTNYNVTGNELTSSAYPEGSLIKEADTSTVYYIDSDGYAREVTTEAAFTANRFSWDNVLTVASGFSMPTMGSDLTAAESDLIDTSSGAGGVAGAGTGLTVSLASDTPASMSVPASATADRSATNVKFIKVNFTASNDGDVTVKGLTFRRVGVGNATDFANVYLYNGDERLTTARSVNSSTNLAVFNNINFVVSAGTTKSLTLVADIGTNTSGNDAFELESASSVNTNGASVSGSFPIMGNTMALAAVSVGKVTVTAGADPSNPNVGASNVDMAQFKLQATGEDMKVHRIALYHAGTVSSNHLSDFKLYYAGEEVASATSINSKNLISLVFDTPFLITKGQQKTFTMKGDISGSAKNSETIIFYVENDADVYAIGETYGFGVGVDINTSGTYDGSSNANKSNCTISGGQLTFNTTGPVASNVRGNEVDFLDFSLASSINAEIRSLRIELIYGGAKSGGTSTNGYITNLKIVDTDSGDTIWGPLDLGNSSSWTDISSGTYSGLGSYHDFTDIVDFSAGETRNFKVVADLNDSLSAGPIRVVLGSTASGWVLSTTAGAKNIDNNQWVSDIVPSAQITGNQMTFTTSALTVSVASSPSIRTVVRGTQEVDALGIFLSTGSASGAKVTDIQVAGYLGGSGYNNFTLYQLGTDKITDTVASIELYDGDTKLGSTESFDTSGYATFENIDVEVDPNSNKKLIVKANLTNTGTTTGAFAIDVRTPNTSVTAYDDNDNAITPADSSAGNNNINGGASPLTQTVYMKMSTGGTLTAQINDSLYPTAIVAGGASNVGMMGAKFYATNEAMTITKLRVTQTSTANSDLSSLTITYPTKSGGTESKTTSFIGANAEFTGMNFYVPKDTWASFTLKANTSTIGSGATSGDSSYVALSTTNFEAVSAEGGTTKVTTFTGTVSGSSNHVMYIRKSVPTVTEISTSYDGNKELAEFSIAADSGTVAVKKITFNVTVSDGEIGSAFTALSATDLKLYRNGVALTTGTDYAIYPYGSATSTVGNRIDNGSGANGSINTTSSKFYIVFEPFSATGNTTGGEETISAGSVNTYRIDATVSGYVSSQDAITTSITVASSTSSVTEVLDSTLASNNSYVALDTTGEVNFIWSDVSDGATHSSVIDAAAATDWIAGYKVIGLQ